MMAWVVACGALVCLPGTMPADEVELEMLTDEQMQQREEGARAWIRMLMQRGDHAAAAAAAKDYLNDAGFRNVRRLPEVALWYAQALDRGGNLPDALVAYSKVWGSYMGQVSISAPAIKRWMEICWDRNLPRRMSDAGHWVVPDRQGAYNGGARFIEATARPGFFDKMTPDERKLWNEVKQLVDTYALDPGIRTLEVQQRERAKAEKARLDAGPWWALAVGLAATGIIAVVVWFRHQNSVGSATQADPLLPKTGGDGQPGGPDGGKKPS